MIMERSSRRNKGATWRMFLRVEDVPLRAVQSMRFRKLLQVPADTRILLSLLPINTAIPSARVTIFLSDHLHMSETSERGQKREECQGS